jgi:hypothetical protein
MNADCFSRFRFQQRRTAHSPDPSRQPGTAISINPIATRGLGHYHPLQRGMYGFLNAHSIPLSSEQGFPWYLLRGVCVCVCLRKCVCLCVCVPVCLAGLSRLVCWLRFVKMVGGSRQGLECPSFDSLRHCPGKRPAFRHPQTALGLLPPFQTLGCLFPLPSLQFPQIL